MQRKLWFYLPLGNEKTGLLLDHLNKVNAFFFKKKKKELASVIAQMDTPVEHLYGKGSRSQADIGTFQRGSVSVGAALTPTAWLKPRSSCLLSREELWNKPEAEATAQV